MDTDRQDWTLYDTDDAEDGPRVWQIREAFPDGLKPAAFPVAVIVEWQYADEGLPDPDTLAALHAFEADLAPLDAPEGDALLTHVIRGGGISELCWYVRDQEAFMQGFNQVLAGKPRYPLAIEFLEDPEWDYRRSIVENFAH
ncbi:DUF695 domain-containing protein [Xanthomonas sp. XNM01]|uniref:DUF695 domain-containing protein n=1 Tax=Xanthomonas sp. XNM01 TaxID=2769289 RepID=UPI001781A76A|nr:DUF695 domain-containing protein [Xanthomonas sp. XNM01]MBD9370687.1 DUF695 domain-containing protein [Xanthomonas sp. XNM01]